jgi:hypothetical protein
MKFISAVAALLIAAPSFAAVTPGFYSGKNKSALFFKKCGLRIHGKPEALHVVSAYDSANVYNIWFFGETFREWNDGEVNYIVSGSISLDSVDAAGTKIFDTIRPSGGETYSLKVKTDASGAPVYFLLEHSSQWRRLNTIECDGLK